MVAAPAQTDRVSSQVTADLVCLSCGYNLRGLDPAGQCPECGTLIERSQGPALLRYSAPRYLRAVRWGIRLACLGLVLLLGINVLMLLPVVTASSLGIVSVVFELLYALLCALTATLIAAGWCLLGAAEPSRAGGERQERNARRLRLSASGSWLLLWLVSIANVLVNQTWPQAAYWLTGESLLLGAPSLAALFFSVRHGQYLAERTEPRRAAGDAETARRVLLWMIGFVVSSFVIVHLNALLPAGMCALDLLLILGGLAVLICGIAFFAAYGVLLLSLSRAVKLELLIATALAAEEAAGG
ncbi:MAG: hypothetical protein ACF8NJ_02250 [Phycisphaerales bacterium JB038]